MKRIRNILLILVLVVLSLGTGYKLGQKDPSEPIATPVLSQLSGKTPTVALDINFQLFWEVWDRLNKSYIDKKQMDPQKMVYGAISGMVASLGDPYTVFLPPEQNKDAKDDLGGRFEGIGAQLGVKDKKIVVIAPLKDSPSQKAGVKPGDWIIKVDNQPTANWTLPEAVTKIRGQKGTKVILTVIHKDENSSSELSVTRDEIKVASVEWEVKKFKILFDKAQDGQSSKIKVAQKNEECADCVQAIYLRLGRFGDQTNDEWIKVVDEIDTIINNPPGGGSTMKGLVFDLRNNPGGYLSSSVFIASEFLTNGTVVIQESSNGTQQKYSVNRKGKLTKIPLVVLVNKGSASASEIVAGAIKDRDRGRLVGETTFGKGSIQDAQELSGGAGIHITTAKWLLPSGIWINGSGLEPNMKVELNEQKPDEDVQLEEALTLLVK